MNDELPEDDSLSTTILPTAFDAGGESLGPCCEKCGATIAAKETLVCQKCGWYASVGSYVEIDRSWEVATNPELATEEDLAPAPQTKLPTWAWILAGCAFAVLVESLAVRLLTSEGSAIRTYWSLSQLFIGFVSFAICHTYSFILVLRNEADVNMLDYLLRPIKSWSNIIRELPKRGWACYLGLSGFVAVALSLLLIGGIPYERLLDWNVKEKAKINLMGAIIEQANTLATEDEKSLEEAIGDFAGKAELEDQKKKTAVDSRKKEDCIIVGFMANQSGEIQTLLLAAEHYARLKYAGNVQATDLSDQDRHELTQKLMASRTHKSFVRMSIDGAVWVKPKYLCRVSYRRRGKQGGLYGTKLVDLLGEMDLGN